MPFLREFYVKDDFSRLLFDFNGSLQELLQGFVLSRAFITVFRNVALGDFY